MSEDAQELPVKIEPMPESPPAEDAHIETPVAEVSAEEAPPVETPPAPSAGALLRQAREASGLHIAALAVSLKVPVKRLEALEADRFDLLPSAVFSRALASSVCRALKIDSAAVLAQLPSLTAPRLEYADQNRPRAQCRLPERFRCAVCTRGPRGGHVHPTTD